MNYAFEFGKIAGSHVPEDVFELEKEAFEVNKTMAGLGLGTAALASLIGGHAVQKGVTEKSNRVQNQAYNAGRASVLNRVKSKTPNTSDKASLDSKAGKDNIAALVTKYLAVQNQKTPAPLPAAAKSGAKTSPKPAKNDYSGTNAAFFKAMTGAEGQMSDSDLQAFKSSMNQGRIATEKERADRKTALAKKEKDLKILSKDIADAKNSSKKRQAINYKKLMKMEMEGYAPPATPDYSRMSPKEIVRSLTPGQKKKLLKGFDK